MKRFLISAILSNYLYYSLHILFTWPTYDYEAKSRLLANGIQLADTEVITKSHLSPKATCQYMAVVVTSKGSSLYNKRNLE